MAVLISAGPRELLSGLTRTPLQAVLDLRFDLGEVDAGITFTRASAKTRINQLGVLESVATDNPAIDHDQATIATSTTSLTVGAGTKSLTLATGSQFAGGKPVRISRTSDSANTWMAGIAMPMADGSLRVIVERSAGSGTFSDWTIIACLGLSIEESRTNRTLRSEDFTVAPWAATVVGTSTRANGSASRGFVVGTVTATSANGGIRQTHAGLTTGQVYTLSFFIKSVATAVLVVLENGTAAYGTPCNVSINPSTGTAGTLTGFTSARVTTFSDGYVYELVLPAAGGALAANIELRIVDGVSAMSLGRPQLEAGIFATSYIPTASATVTRSADVASLTGTAFSDWYNTSEGVFVTKFKTKGVLSALPSIAQISDGTANNRLIAGYGSTTVNFDITTAGTAQSAIVAGSAVSGTQYALSAAYKANDIAASLAVATVVTDTSATLPVVDRINLGSRYDGAGNFLNGYLSRLSYYDTHLPNTLLPFLSGP